MFLSQKKYRNFEQRFLTSTFDSLFTTKLPQPKNDLLIILIFILYCICVTIIARSATKPGTSGLTTNPGNGIDPLILHYVWLENRGSTQPRDLSALQYLSVLSAITILRPDRIHLHTNGHFSGPHWHAVKPHVTLTNIATFPAKKSILKGKMHIEHEADLVKLQIAYESGGLFADFDVYFTGHREKYLASFQRYDCVFAQFHTQKRTFFAIGNFGCQAKSPFIQAILQEYRTNFRGYKCYDPNDPIPFLYNGCLYPYLLYQGNEKFQKSIKIEIELLNMFPKKDLFLNQNNKVEWVNSFNVHSGYEGPDISLSQIWSWKSTFGEVLRFIVNKEVVSSKVPAVTSPRKGSKFAFTTEVMEHVSNDLTTLQFLAVLCAIRKSNPATIEIGGFRSLSGPFWTFLLDEANAQKILLFQGAKNEDLRMASARKNYFIFNLSSFVMKPLHSCDVNFDVLPEGCKVSVFHFNRTHFKPSKRAVKFSLYSVIDIGVIPSLKRDVTLETIRKLTGTFGELLRLVYFGDTEMLRDQPLRHFPCGQ